MTEEGQKKSEIFHGRMLNQYGISQLSNLGIYKKLILALTIRDIEELEVKNVYFNPLFSPASQTDLVINLCKGSKIITVDLNTLKLFSEDEGVAIILHEIGHALNPDKKGENGEFEADDYAVNRNYKNSIISSLEKAKLMLSEEFIKEITEKRINRLKKT